MPTTGAKPIGAQDESHAAEAVQQMFNAIAPRYDLLNHVLSANIDRLWWRRTASRFQTVLANPNAAVLDICCGTGDLTMALLKHRPSAARPILAADFAHGMLRRGAHKFSATKPNRSVAIALEADALHLPLRSAIARSDCHLVRLSQSGQLRSWAARVPSRTETGRPTRHPRVQRTRRPHRQDLRTLLSPRIAGHRTYRSAAQRVRIAICPLRSAHFPPRPSCSR